MIKWKNNGRKKKVLLTTSWYSIYIPNITLYLNAIIMHNGKQYSLGEYIQKTLFSWWNNEIEKVKRKQSSWSCSFPPPDSATQACLCIWFYRKLGSTWYFANHLIPNSFNSIFFRTVLATLLCFLTFTAPEKNQTAV